MAYLLFSRGPVQTFRFLIRNTSTKIGRSAQCDLALEGPEISREHASIHFVEGSYHLKQLGQGGLKVNGKEGNFFPLRDRDEIHLGSWRAVFFLENPIDLKEYETSVTEASREKTQAVAFTSKGFLVQSLQLSIQSPGEESRLFPFKADVLNIGASSKNDLVLSDPYVSSRHLKLVKRDGKVLIYDLGSTNGTFLNGVKIQEAEWDPAFSLRIGKIQIGLQVEENIETADLLETEEFCGMIGSSPSMQSVYGQVKRMGPTEATVLILGESGSGKELVAKALHQLSSRRRGPFIPINCGAISSELIESELFGHEKGAFTGALKQHDGAFGQAENGTLFLDEVGELPLELQPKLLRVLENRSYRRVGGQEELHANVRVVAATHRDLGRLVKSGKFREDLFFRLFVLPLFLPPLRTRCEDVPLLCEHFLKEFGAGSMGKTLSSSALDKLKSHSFPGNIRELKNILLRSVILASKPSLEASDLLFFEEMQPVQSAETLPETGLETLEEMERRWVLKALQAHRWNKARAAASLGLAKSTLFAKIKLYNLEESRT